MTDCSQWNWLAFPISTKKPGPVTGKSIILHADSNLLHGWFWQPQSNTGIKKKRLSATSEANALGIVYSGWLVTQNVKSALTFTLSSNVPYAQAISTTSAFIVDEIWPKLVLHITTAVTLGQGHGNVIQYIFSGPMNFWSQISKI